MNKSKIAEDYSKGKVNITEICEEMINDFKNDNLSLDIQQCRFLINYFIMKREE